MTPCHFPVIDATAVSAWLAEIATQFPEPLVFALLPEAEKERVGDLQSWCNASKVSLLGAIFPALVNENGFSGSGLTLICLSQTAGHFLVTDLDKPAVDAAGRIAAALAATPKRLHRTGPQQLFLVFDSMLPNTASILAKLFDRLKQDFRYAGINAGSETFKPMPCLFDNQRLVGNGAIGMVMATEVKVGVQHGYPVSKPLMRASSTEGNRIDRIDGKPAMTVYQQVIASEFGIKLTPENFYDYAVHYPFGLVGSLEILVRIPVAFNEDGSIFCVGEVPANSMLRLLKAPPLAASDCVRGLLALLGEKPAVSLLAFYCAGRRMHFGEQAETELRQLHVNSKATALYGALSLGEISTDNDLGIPEFHNAALVCLR